MPARPIIIDCDPGQDDAVALLLAFASPAELDVLGVTVVAGNVPLARTHDNARRVCELAGRRDIGVHAGCDRPLLRAPLTAEDVHGQSGLDGAELPAPTLPLSSRHAVDFIIETLLAAADAQVTLAPTGPLTNIALALLREPRITPKIREIVLMGGAMGLGNRTPSAEFNILADPHAAAIVFGCGRPIVMHGLDVTLKVITTDERRARIQALGGPVAEAVAGWLGAYAHFHRQRYGRAGGPLHDPCVIAYLLRPGLFAGRTVNVAIETASDLTLGRTVVDWHSVTGRPANATVIDDVDANGFYDLLVERLGRY